jgi:hypothetical protein
MMETNGTNAALHAMIEAQAKESFTDPASATDTEALGILLAHHFGWGGEPILATFLAALEDANFHTLRLKVIEAAEADGLNVSDWQGVPK